jgi:hypothetical protein
MPRRREFKSLSAVQPCMIALIRLRDIEDKAGNYEVFALGD